MGKATDIMNLFEDKPITPIIKKMKIIEHEVEICPHCMKEIGEKQTYIDKDGYEYHSPCKDKGAIAYHDPAVAKKLAAQMLGWNESVNGTECPICGEHYEMRCRCKIADSRCPNGHEWHRCPIHKTLVLSSYNHSGRCTCGEG